MPQTNPLEGQHTPCEATVDWNDPALAAITRWRFVTDNGFPFWDESYCHGVLKDGTHVRVQTGLFQVPRKGFAPNLAMLFKAATADGVSLNRLCGGHIRNVLSLCW